MRLIIEKVISKTCLVNGFVTLMERPDAFILYSRWKSDLQTADMIEAECKFNTLKMAYEADAWGTRRTVIAMGLGWLKCVLIILFCMLQYWLFIDNIWSTLDKTIPFNVGRDALHLVKTAKGMVSMKEIESNLWEPFGYSLVSSSSQLIPTLKQKTPDTCETIFDNWQKISDKGLTVNPPENLEPRDKFSLNGYARIMPCHMNSVFKNDDNSVKNASDDYWSNDAINRQIADGKAGNFNFFPYADSISVHHATKHHDIVGKVGAVIGSLTPWVEVLCLMNGAEHLFTVDYQKVDIGHPNVSFIHALDLVKGRDMYFEAFDFVVSYSSIEHSGLGRYGDPIDPIGDLREMQKVRCIFKPGGLFFFSVPHGLDTTGFNCHRSYGRIRLAMMFAGFELISVFKSDEGKPHEMTLEELYKERDPYDYPHLIWVLRKTSRLNSLIVMKINKYSTCFVQHMSF
ncbi:hypothetical protein DdX_18446 [Ditylenchus destructor]|uniref:DUF268 domain-containing protein n=1 Tax=Ditylenchus destructor TaxID=166010 RepID=A0AAD4MJX2_9BILA|nr:hypothetical protein DdX_18446 [Ditylenchus destructor]